MLKKDKSPISCPPDTLNANPIRWDAKGVPHSIVFRDKYFCTQNGLEEYRYILKEGNSLKERFLALDPSQEGTFVVGETGFGTGLSFCALWELWENCAPVSWSLHFISVELYPLSKTELDRALSVWPALEKYRALLSAQYAPLSDAIRDFYFENKRVRLTIAFEDVVDALKKVYQQNILKHKVDAWLLNGFSPFANPRMWELDVFKGMARLSKKGTTFSTFTVAGAVRRRLQEAGFAVEKFPGYGIKKQMLRGRFAID